MNEKDLLSFWQLSFESAGNDSLITGSPNRTEKRFLFKDDKGDSYIAEGYDLTKAEAQKRQNQILEYLAGNHLDAVYPFLRTADGAHGVIYHGLFWQIRPYIPAENIYSREEICAKEEYGILWGDFLLQMKEKIQHASGRLAMPNARFSVSGFFPELMKHAERKMPSITEQLREMELKFAPFFKWERKMDLMFAHGDFHPGNILTEKGKIKVVIDWEFARMKFPGYDMALLVGCLAMDDPENLSSPAVKTFLKHLYCNDFLTGEVWENLSFLIAATRLGWLGEWLTLEDETLIAQEMQLLSMLLKV